MYERRSRLRSHQQGELLKMFVVGATARAAAERRTPQYRSEFLPAFAQAHRQ